MRDGRLEERLREVARGWTPGETHRDHVLAAAAPLVRPVVTWSDRVWFSSRWRLAAAAVAVAAFALDFAFSASPASPVDSREHARETAQVVDEAARQAGLDVEEAHMFAQRAFALASQPDPAIARAATPGAAVGAGEMK